MSIWTEYSLAVPPPLVHVTVLTGVKVENKTCVLKTLAVASTFSLLPSVKNHPSGSVALEVDTSARLVSLSTEPFVMSVVSLTP